MDKKFTLGLINNEVGVILKTAKIKCTTNISSDEQLVLSFTNESKRNNAYDNLYTRFNNKKMFGYTSSITKDSDKLIYISLK